ncbi:DUF6575 domain-containing protein [Serratia sp. DD3]|uniref:DUF6575 domain-containing protein n=1 Tax=Serratia sp. DD3 TaxID=1410619 RepID=UPI0004D472E9|nr:DUF6575 domain-containing protein [Serratia sp. DD3]KEY58487.1 hypothetical protein SRDD_27340 [Serratia sp. DD3]
MDNIFIESPFLGKLRMVNIYEEYDGPRLFSAENEIGTSFLVYWVGTSSSSDEWFVIPCSRMRIVAFEKGKVDLLGMLTKLEQHSFYKVITHFDKNKDIIITPLPLEEMSSIDLPDSGIFVDADEIISASLINLNNDLIPTHEIKVSRSNKAAKKNVLLDHVTRVCEKFSELVSSFNSTNEIKGDIQPLTARYGSFVLSLHATEMEKFERFISEVSGLMLHKKDIKPYLIRNDIDVKAFSSLLEAIVSTSVNFELKSKFNEDELIVIYKADAIRYLRDISSLSLQYVSTYQVPQADDLGKVFRIVDMTWNGDEITKDRLGVDPRHVEYYRQAAKILGFLESNGALSALGQQVASVDPGGELRYRMAARSFEMSACGWAWINWSGAKNLTEVDSTKAEQFLKQSCPSLSSSTAHRRARTLARWCRELQKYYVSW